jgi:HEAT repeat protein
MGFFGPPDVEKLKNKRDIKGLLAALKYKEDEAVRKNAALALSDLAASISPDMLALAIPQLIQALNDAGYGVMPAVVQTLAAIGQPSILPLISVLRSPQDSVREGAARALGRIGASLSDPTYLHLPIDPLIGVLKDNNFLVRRAAIWALGRLAPRLDSAQRSLPLEGLFLVMNDPIPEVRETVAVALGRLGEGRGIRPLYVILEDESAPVRKAAGEALDSLGWRPTTVDEQAVYFVATQNWERAISIGAVSVPAFTRALTDRERDVRKIAAAALGKIGGPDVILPLVGALKDVSNEVRKTATEALEQAGAPQAVEPLLIAARDTDHDVRKAVIKALGHTADPRAVPLLVSILKTREDDLIALATQALTHIGAPAVAHLIPVLHDPDTLYREAATEAIVSIGAPSLNALIETLRLAHSPVSEYAARILGRIGDPRAVYPLMTALESPNLTPSAALALGKIRDPRAVKPLLELLDSNTDAIRQAAIIGLGDISDPIAVDDLIQLLKADDHATRQNAANALIQIYKTAHLDINSKRKILAQQDRINEAHTDNDVHADTMRSSSVKHRDETFHLDTGIGIDFPKK